MTKKAEMSVETVIDVLTELLHEECDYEESMTSGHGRALGLAIEWLKDCAVLLPRPTEEEMAWWDNESAKEEAAIEMGPK